MTTGARSYWDRAVPVAAEDRRSEDSDVVVVGAGLTGLCTALLLARAGLEVVVVEATRVGALASGKNTGKVSVLQGTKVSQISSTHSAAVARAYADANSEGAAWLRRFCDDHGVGYQLRDAITFAADAAAVPAVQDELSALTRLGLDARWRSSLDVPFDVHGAVVLPDQVQLDPMAVLEALVQQLEGHGGRVVEGDRVVAASWGRSPAVRTAAGRRFRCRHLVLATGAPILDRGLYFAKLEARRSYLLAFTGAQKLPGMMISAGPEVRSLRDVPGDPDVLLVGGAGHVVGRGRAEGARVEELRRWVGRHYPDAVETHAWSAQDYRSHDGIPYVGRLPRGRGSIWLAAGYDKWGLANSVAASLRITGMILGDSPSWAVPLERRVTRPADAATLLGYNLRAAGTAAARLVEAERRTVSPDHPPVVGQVGRVGVDPRPVGVVAEGCAVRAVCTHLGGTLRWNDAEQSWDCPLHGSRFAPGGEVIEGPAVTPLTPWENG
ncbi:FAD-dependent oxidoreductase [Marmoricola sp. RAF53]|uniref:FAD-dependent oxidoreductase n=1 Tax=Marmoricola sp. RAF53 TaxID=3233059 RepID=UPI003F960A80